MSEKEMRLSHINTVLVFCTFLFGVNPIIVKLGITAMDPRIFTSSRLMVAIIGFGCVLWHSKSYKPLSKKDIVWFVKMGFEVAVFQLGMIYALELVSAAIVATMIGLIPISTLVIHSVKGSRKIMSYHYIGTFITFLGVLCISQLLSGSAFANKSDSLLGIALLFVAQFAAASYMVTAERMLKKYSHYQVSTCMFFFGLLIFLAVSIPQFITLGMPEVTIPILLCILYGGLVSLCLANVLWIWGIKQVGSHKAVIFNNLPPIFALIVGILFLNEIPTPVQVMGVFLVLVGLYIFNGKLVSRTI